jgi:tRNA-splicing ligase RtcB
VHDIGSLEPASRVAVMPDAHKGYGMPIGTMLATNDAVVPYAVGVDIGCGMIAAKTTLRADALTAGAIREACEGIYRRVPVGLPTRSDKTRGRHGGRQNSAVLREWHESRGSAHRESSRIRERADRQLGTLGASNHFLEIQVDTSEGDLWFMLHSGSRSFGKAMGDHWARTAADSCERRGRRIPNRDLGYLSMDEEGRSYVEDMSYALRFAEESRGKMYERCLEALSEALGEFDVSERIETVHNFAAVETHDGRELVVHRKGAVRTTSDGEGVLVTIPGSMQTGSYIGRGKPNALALDTCAHGAGRVLGRSAARKTQVGVDIRADMAAQGIALVCPPDADVLDEAGRAYKDIEDVMRYQSDLVEPLIRLRPLGVVKG